MVAFLAATALSTVPASAVPVPSVQVCKKAAPGSTLPASFTFTVSPPNTTVVVPVGQCRQVVVNASNPQGITVTEAPAANTSVIGINVTTGTTMLSSLANRTVTVADDAYVFEATGHIATSGDAGTITFTNKSDGLSACYPPTPFLPDMIAWYPFDEATGLNAVNLRPPSASAYLANGPTHVPGKVGNGLRFDLLDDFARGTGGPYPNVGTGNFSFDFWINTAAANGTHVFIDKREGVPGDGLRGYVVAIQNGKVLLQMADDGGSGGYTNFLSDVYVADGQWHFVAITVNRTSIAGIRFYKDSPTWSMATGNPTVRPGSLTNDANLTFGKDALAAIAIGLNPPKLTLDEVEIFRVALMPSQVAGIWNAGASGKCK